jgi:lipopolysaccharide export system permease protein
MYSAIEFGYQVLPVACFLGALVAGTILSRRGELLAIYAAGIRSIRLWLTFAGVALVISGLGAACGEWAVPRAVTRIHRLSVEQFRHTAALNDYYSQRAKWFKEGDILLYLPSVDIATQIFSEPTIYRLESGLLAEVIMAQKLFFTDNAWHLAHSKSYRVDDVQMKTADDRVLNLRVKPDDLIDVTGNPKEMTTPRVRQLIERRQNAGFETTTHQVELHSRFAFPLLAFAMVLLSLPWIMHPDRRRSLSTMLGFGLIVVAMLLSLTQILRLLALARKIPAPLGAWAPLLIALMLLPISIAVQKRWRS